MGLFQVLGLIQVERPTFPESIHVARRGESVLMEAPAHRVMPTRKQLEAGESKVAPSNPSNASADLCSRPLQSLTSPAFDLSIVRKSRGTIAQHIWKALRGMLVAFVGCARASTNTLLMVSMPACVRDPMTALFFLLSNSGAASCLATSASRQSKSSIPITNGADGFVLISGGRYDLTAAIARQGGYLSVAERLDRHRLWPRPEVRLSCNEALQSPCLLNMIRDAV